MKIVFIIFLMIMSIISITAAIRGKTVKMHIMYAAISLIFAAMSFYGMVIL